MPQYDPFAADFRDMLLRLAGEAGQVSLARSGESAGLRAVVDQHAAEIRDALARPGREPTQAALLNYARGFMEAAVGRGWWPPHRRRPDRDPCDPWPDPGEPELDWESLRLAAVCRMLADTRVPLA